MSEVLANRPPERNADPAGYVDYIESLSTRIETPCADGTMSWRIWGEGEPLVLGHGAQGAWSHWIANIERLSRHRRLIVADLPGHGTSALPDTQDHEGIARALATGLREICGPGIPVDLCGFSFGGVAFAHVAAYHPDVARRLIIVGCGGLDTPHGPPDLKRVSGTRGEERRAVLKHNLLGLMLHDEESADELAIHMLLPTAKAARLQVPGLVMPDRLKAVLPQIRCPVDAIWGEFDRPHPDPSVQEAVIRGIQPGCDFRVVEGAGHWAMYERPEAFEAALLGILSKPPRHIE